MEEKPLQVIRETTRNLVKMSRQIQRDELTDIGRSIDTPRITADTIADIANRLKNKTAVSLPELHTLKNTLIDDKKNIDIVLGTQGALRGIVRELSGQDVKRQCAAAGCLCNLALGDSKACNTIAKAAGSYLVTALDNLSIELAVLCAWALGNIAGADIKACETLIAQGSLAKLTELLHKKDDVEDAASYALVHLCQQMKNELSAEYVKKISEAFSTLPLNMTACQLLFTISCHKDFDVTPELLEIILAGTSVSTEQHLQACKGTECNCDLIYLLRTLANVSVTKVNSDFVLSYLMETQLVISLKRVLGTDNGIVKESLMWLLGNLYNFCSDPNIFNELICC